MPDAMTALQPRDVIRRSLTPGDHGLTEELVFQSGLARLRDVTAVAGRLLLDDRFQALHEAVSDTVTALQAQADAVLYRQLGSPIFRGWLNEFGRVEQWDPSDALLMRLLALWNNMLINPYGSDFEATFGVVDGWMMTWDPLVATRVPVEGEVTVSKSEETLKQLAPDGRLLGEMHVAADRFGSRTDDPPDGHPLLPATMVAVRNDLPLLRLKLNESGPPSRHSGIEWGVIDDRIEAYGPFDSEPFLQTAGLLLDTWPEEYADLARTLQVVVPRDIRPGWDVEGFTVSSHQGACWIVARSVPRIVETLVHEHSHVKLRYLEECHPILADQQSDRLFEVAWRSDPRPLVGLYEGVFVFNQAVTALERVAAEDSVDRGIRSACDERAAEMRPQIQQGLEILCDNARFTEAGAEFLAWAEEQPNA